MGWEEVVVVVMEAAEVGVEVAGVCVVGGSGSGPVAVSGCILAMARGCEGIMGDGGDALTECDRGSSIGVVLCSVIR